MQSQQHVTFDRKSLILDGKRRLLFSGSIHYWRLEPEEWRPSLTIAKAAGLDAFETSLYWGLHEPTPHTYNFEGRNNFPAFVEIAHEVGLDAFLRVGPYACAEVNYGGLPIWLRRDADSKLRLDDPLYMEAATRWFTTLAPILKRLSRKNGGPMIAVQIENEYGNVARLHGEEAARSYMWKLFSLVQEMDLGVPIVTCDYDRFEWGQPPSVLNGINSNSAVVELPEHWKRFPDQPGIWVENWVGWYDTWGYARLVKPIEATVSRTARFITAGGSWINYYMWHGGRNFAREEMYLQATNYDFDAPINEYGQQTTKALVLSEFHHAIKRCEHLILEGLPTSVNNNGSETISYRLGADTVDLNFSEWTNTAISEKLDPDGNERSTEQVTIALNGEVIFDLASSLARNAKRLTFTDLPTGPLDWTTEKAVLPSQQQATPDGGVDFFSGHEEYVWYIYHVDVPESGRQTLVVKGAADFLSVYVDGRFAGHTPLPLKEVRDRSLIEDFTHRIPIDIDAGSHELHILVNNLGWVKGEWSLGYKNLGCEQKGIWDPAPTLGESPLVLKGLANWQPHAREPLERDPSSKSYPLPLIHTVNLPIPPSSDPLALWLVGLSKGLLYINDQIYYRYWLIHAMKNQRLEDLEPGEFFTQQYYRLPCVQKGDSIKISLFDEHGAFPNRVALVKAAMEPCSLADYYASRKPRRPISTKVEKSTVLLTTTMTGVE